MSSTKSKPTQVRKRKNRWPGLTKSPISSLPDDLLVSCLARVSRLYYRTLSLVSKRFRSLLASPELYKARSNLGRNESCLYVCLQYPSDIYPRWFTLCRKPDKTLTKNSSKKSSGNILVPVFPPNHHLAQSSKLIAVDSKIYGFGREEWSSSSTISVLDCRKHTWHKTPSMRAMRSCSSKASLVDGKIYVAGRNSLECVEVFDPKTQTWDSITNPPDIEKYHGGKLRCFGLEGKFYLFGAGLYHCDGAVYNPEERKWNPLGLNKNLGYALSCHSYCVIDNVLFHRNFRDFEWYDFKVGLWKKVEGLCEGLKDFHRHYRCKMVDYGGKLVALWDVMSCCAEIVGNQENKIWCAEIALEKRNGEYGDEIWGNVEWLDVVLTVPRSCRLLEGDALSVTI